jgi:hypothetical protein
MTAIDVALESRIMAQVWCGWMQGGTEDHSRGDGLRECRFSS